MINIMAINMYGAKVKLYTAVLKILLSEGRNMMLVKNRREKQNPKKNMNRTIAKLVRRSMIIRYQVMKAGKNAAITCWIRVQYRFIYPGCIQMSIAQKIANRRFVIPKIKKLLSKRERTSMTMNTTLIAMRKAQTI
jgi:O-glycosyl hydrolase